MKIKYLAAIFILGLLASGAWRQYAGRKWLGWERFTVIELEPRPEVSSFDPATGRGLRIELPGELEIETVGGRGRWRVEVMGELAGRWGRKWMADSIADYLGIAYTGTRSELSLWDRWNWWRRAGNIRWEKLDLEKAGAVAHRVLVDGERVLGLTDGWYEAAQGRFVSAQLASQKVGVKIVNTTGVTGLGAHAARVIESGGLRVIEISSGNPEGSGECRLEGGKEEKEGPAGQVLAKIFGCRWSGQSSAAAGEVSLFLGEEYRRWWLGDE